MKDGRPPLHYWPIMLMMLVIYMALGGAVADMVGTNPYVGAAVFGVLLVLYETWSGGRTEKRS